MNLPMSTDLLIDVQCQDVSSQQVKSLRTLFFVPTFKFDRLLIIYGAKFRFGWQFDAPIPGTESKVLCVLSFFVLFAFVF